MSNEEKSVSLEEAAQAVAESEEEAAKEVLASEDAEAMQGVAFDPNAPIITVRKLIEAGSHYGHQTRKWNPKMKKYIFCARNGIYLIDLVKTKSAVESAYEKLKSIVLEGGKVLLVGTKPNAKEVVKEEAERSGSFYIINRWLGGTLTNFKTIQTRIKKLKDLEQAEVDGRWDSLPKKEVAALRKEREKLSKNLEGIKEMRKLPQAVIVVDPMEERIAIKEALKLHIPTFAICDTNCDPDGIDFVIPGNDDTQKSVKLIVSVLSDAIVEAKGGLPEVAYANEEGEDATMIDAQRQADRENALRLAAKKEMLREKQEKEKARYFNRFDKNKEGSIPAGVINALSEKKATPNKQEKAEKKVEEKGE